MTQRLDIYQSLWAMERRIPTGMSVRLKTHNMIAQAGFNGVSASYASRDDVRRLCGLLRPLGLHAEGQCFRVRWMTCNPSLNSHRVRRASQSTCSRVRPRSAQ